METSPDRPSYQCFRQFNQTPLGALASSHLRLDAALADRYFTADTLQDRFVRALGDRRALSVKEVLESFEFFQRVRKYVRAPAVADLCCGHGLAGILMALFERSVERVTLIDRHQPPNHARTLACAVEVGPWVADKVRFKSLSMKDASQHLEPHTAVLATHACGLLTDRCIDAALQAKGAVALMPCCYPDRKCAAPPAVQQALGTSLAFDIHRTYRLEAAGYRVRWDAIPPQITPMNRILVARRPTGSPCL